MNGVSRSSPQPMTSPAAAGWVRAGELREPGHPEAAEYLQEAEEAHLDRPAPQAQACAHAEGRARLEAAVERRRRLEPESLPREAHLYQEAPEPVSKH